MTADHAGKYEVFVENSAGRDHRFFSVAVEGSPDPPAGIPNVSCSARTTTITWRSPPYDGGCTVTGYTVEMNRVGESTWSTVTESCHSLSHDIPNHELLGDSYRFRIRAENIHGLSEASAESNIVKIPEGGETVIRDKEDGFEAPFEAHLVDIEDGRLFGERYEVFEELGKGRYGIVRRVIEKTKDVSFAAKFVRTIKAKDREQVREEIKIMNMLRHPKLLLLAAAFESPREIVMVTEYISGGELFERVVADDFTLTERDGILFMRQICEGVEYMHKNNVVHLDLKPENIMCRTRTSHQIKLIDFGLAQTLKPDTPIRVLFGTPEFIPPEIISYEPIGTESDMWSVGVICYVLLTGLSPFMGDNDAETFANITRADYDLEDEAFDAISNNAKDFISGLLVKRKELRMSARQCLEHPWMAQHAEAMSRVALSTDKLKKFIVRRKWQKTGNAIRALGRMAILSANSRRPTTSAESSPTSDPRTNPIESQSFLKSLQDGEKSSNVEANYTDEHRENFTKLNSRENNVYAFCYKTEVIIPSEEPTESIRNDEQSSSSCLISVSKEESTKNDISALIADNNRPLVDEETETNQNPRNIFDENRQKLEPGNELQLNTLDPYTKNEDEPTKITNIQIQESLITENISFSADEIEILQMNLESKTVLTSSTEEDSNMQKSEIASRSKNVAEEIVSELHYEDLKNTDEEHNSDFNANTVVGNDNEEFQTELEPKTISKPQSQRRMFRGDSRDSGIGDCNSSLATSSQQLDQLGIVSIIEEEIDNDVHNEEKCEQADLTTGLERKMKILEVELENTKASMKERKGSTKLAVQSDLIKTSCMTNQQCEDVVESEDPRVISRIRNKFVPTGNVSRTAKLFEKEKASTWSQINTVQSTAVQRTYPAAAVVATKPHNERIQKAFAFWNK
ncbi:hypothetical protein KM043_015967 [Ampulex compressa]|nr:hypothetical protein KM043_015967 [Ampulex compressa]